MSSFDSEESRQNFALRLQSATPRERRALLREQGESPDSTRKMWVFLGLFFAAGGVAALIEAIGAHEPMSHIAPCLVFIALACAVAELSRRGRTRLGKWVFFGGIAALSLATVTLNIGT